ncbi:hypothetical protein CF328_g5842 [Tilletia controversa]|nr:hypothetical protein CF328_g5842 [Tilletia controversa]
MADPLLILTSPLSSCLGSSSWDQDQLGLPPSNDRDGPFLENTYFVEFNEVGAVESISERDQHDDFLHRQLEAFLSEQHKIPFKRRFTFTDRRLILGTSLQLENPNHVKVLSEFHAVKKVHPVRKVSPGWARTSTSSSDPSPISRSNHHSLSRHRRPLSERRAVAQDTPVLKSSSKIPASTYAPLRMIGADKLHAQGYLGRGQKIAIIDSGIDYTHHALNGGKPDGTACFRGGCPITGGRSFVDESGNQVNSSNPFANCLQGWHGTFTSGLLIANAPDRNFTGIVPQAQLAMYRVFGCQPHDTADDLIMYAMQAAFQDGAEILSMSIGRTDGWHGDSPVDQLATRLSDLGMHIVISGGNLGRFGAFQAESPSNTPRVDSVGSVQNNVLQGYTARIKGKRLDKEITYFAANPLTYNETSTFPIYATSSQLDPDNDACTPLLGSVPTLTKFAVLVEQSMSPVCRPPNQRNTVMQKDARVILSYGSAQNAIMSAAEANGKGIQLVALSHEDGIMIKAALNSGKNVSIDFSNPRPKQVVDKMFGGLASNFSQLGPSWDLHFSTLMSAPGGQAFSTLPVALGSYGVGDGTSYATPLIAGAVALYRSIKGSHESPLELRRIFTTTAVPALSDKANNIIDSVARQGAGMIDVYKAVHSQSRASPDYFALNDTKYLNGTQQLTITNIGDRRQHFTMSHVPAGTVHALDGSPGYFFRKGPLVPQNSQQAVLRFTPRKFVLAAGASRSVTVTFVPPPPDQLNLPIISGFVVAKSDQPFGSLSVPYLGVAAALNEYPVLQTQQPPGLYHSNGTLMTKDGRIFTLENGDRPELRYWFLMATQHEFTVLVHANTSYVATIPTFPQTPRAGRGCTSATLPAEDYVATVDDSYYLDRSLGQPDIVDYGTSLLTKSATDQAGKQRSIEDGDYRLLLRVLKLQGDPSQESSYQSYLSPMFRIRQKSKKTLPRAPAAVGTMKRVVVS